MLSSPAGLPGFRRSLCSLGRVSRPSFACQNIWNLSPTRRGVASWNSRVANCRTIQRRDIHADSHGHDTHRVYILGLGSVGKLVAHAMRSVPDPPAVTLLYHRPTFKAQFENAGRIIKLQTGRNTEERGGFDAELALPRRRNLRLGHDVPMDHEKYHEEHGQEMIHNLVLTVKAQDTVSALTPILHRLSPRSTILFLQNGMGTIEECNEKLFPDPSTRPAYMIGINSHGVHSTSAFAATHAGLGTIMLGLVPRTSSIGSNTDHSAQDHTNHWADSSRYLLRVLTKVPLLAAVALSPQDLRQAQLEKLAVNCVINPLTVMLDGRNGDILGNFALSRTMFLLLTEVSLVIQALPEMRGVPNLKLRFSPERLQRVIVNVAEKTAENISSMLQDVRRGTKTEVEYINGYIVKKGEECGIKPVMNYLMMQMVVGKQQMINREIGNYSPFTKRSG